MQRVLHLFHAVARPAPGLLLHRLAARRRTRRGRRAGSAEPSMWRRTRSWSCCACWSSASSPRFFEEETGAARLQQIGLFTLIFVLQNDAEPVTASQLATLSGQAHSEVSRQVQKLLKIGLVERTAITSPHYRGRAWHLSVKRGPESEKLLKALFGAAEGIPESGSKSGAKARRRRTLPDEQG
jgi:hypothetical protein